MKAHLQYFKEPTTDALKELYAWAEKWLREEVKVAMLVVEREDRNCVITMISEELPEPTRADRLQILQRAVEAIVSNRSDASHVKVQL